MKFFFVFSIIFFITACNNKSGNNRDSLNPKPLSDTLSLADSADAKVQSNESDSVAYANIKFGITKGIYEAVKKPDFNKIGKYKFIVTPFFDSTGFLYRLEFLSEDSVITNSFGSNDIFQILFEMISQKYGKAKVYEKRRDFYYYWEQNQKNIQLENVIAGDGYDKVEFDIYDANMQEKAIKQNALQEKIKRQNELPPNQF